MLTMNAIEAIVPGDPAFYNGPFLVLPPGGMVPSFSCLKVDQVCVLNQVLYGDRTNGTGYFSEKGLDDISGIEGCVLPHPYFPLVQEISEIHV